MTDWKALCAELLDAEQDQTVANDSSSDRFDAVAARARAALAQTAPPAEGEVAELVAALKVIDRMQQEWVLLGSDDGTASPSLTMPISLRRFTVLRDALGKAHNLLTFLAPQPVPADDLLQTYQAGRRDAEADAQQAAEAAQDPPAAGEVAWMYRGEPDFDGTTWRENWKVTTDYQLAVFRARPDQPVPLFPAHALPIPRSENVLDG